MILVTGAAGTLRPRPDHLATVTRRGRYRGRNPVQAGALER